MAFAICLTTKRTTHVTSLCWGCAYGIPPVMPVDMRTPLTIHKNCLSERVQTSLPTVTRPSECNCKNVKCCDFGRKKLHDALRFLQAAGTFACSRFGTQRDFHSRRRHTNTPGDHCSLPLLTSVDLHAVVVDQTFCSGFTSKLR